jgi:hypothetical protein
MFGAVKMNLSSCGASAAARCGAGAVRLSPPGTRTPGSANNREAVLLISDLKVLKPTDQLAEAVPSTDAVLNGYDQGCRPPPPDALMFRPGDPEGQRDIAASLLSFEHQS